MCQKVPFPQKITNVFLLFCAIKISKESSLLTQLSLDFFLFSSMKFTKELAKEFHVYGCFISGIKERVHSEIEISLLKKGILLIVPIRLISFLFF